MLPKTAQATTQATAQAQGDNPEDKIVLTETASPKAHESFDQMRAISRGIRDQLIEKDKQLTAIKAELESAKKGVVGPDAEEVTRLRDEHKKMSDRLMLVDLQEHPQFQREFVAPRDAALAAAQEIAGPDAKLSGLLSLSRKDFGNAVSEIAKNLTQFDQTDFADAMRRAYQLKHQADQALSKSREVYQGLRQQTASAQKRAFSEVVDPLWAKVSEHLVTTDIPADATPQVRSALERYNNELGQIRVNAERIATATSDPKDIATAALKAAAYDFHINMAMPRLLGEYQALLNERQALKAQLADIRGRAPGRQLSPTPTSEPASSTADLSKMGHHEAAEFLARRGAGIV